MLSFISLERRKARRHFAVARFAPQIERLEERAVPAMLGQSLFPADNPWNQQIAEAPTAANSTAIINNIVSRYGNGALHPDFSQNFGDSRDLYGIPFNIVHGNSTPKVSVVIDGYPDESDLVPAPLTANMVLEGDFQNGPRVGVNNRGDSHLLVWDVDNNIAWEFYRASRPSENADGRWHADQETMWDMKTNTYRTRGWTSADAAGLSLLAGLVRPDEALPVSQGGQGVINHAIRFTLRNDIILDQYLYPASHVANPGNNNPAIQPPMGARFRLKADVDISQLNPQSQIVAQAMKNYGMILADNGSNFFFSGASSSVNANNQLTLTWNDNDIQDSQHGLKSLRFSDFEVVDLTPVVTSVSTSSGPTGTHVTITGQNFSGASGQLKVLFGNTASSSVTFVDDRHLIATAPAGSGTVDIRVQSGVTTPADGDNIKSSIFGYGISAVNTNARFTYGSAPQAVNARPFIVNEASANPNPVTGFSALFSVLGGDDGGEENLTYSWSGGGAGPVTFSAPDGTNAAKSTNVIFTEPGNYNFSVTIRDSAGLTVTSFVSVTVLAAPANAAPTIQTPAQASPSTVTGTSTILSVLGSDDGGEANLTYSWTSTGPAAVTYSLNDSNAAKSTNVVFAQPGSYLFTVTVRDAAGLTAISSVTVTVLAPPTNQAPTVQQAAKAASSTINGFSTTVSTLGADDGGEANLTYTWTSTGPAAVAFSTNDTNAAKNATASFKQSGNYTLVVTIKDAEGLTTTSSTSMKVTIPTSNKAPTVKQQARAHSMTATGVSKKLSVLGKDDAGEANLTYTWTTRKMPEGAANPTFTVNGSNLAKNTTVTFFKAGFYTFDVTITDAQGLTAKSSVCVLVRQKATSIALTPNSATVAPGQTLQFQAQAYDQFNDPLVCAKYYWRVQGRGRISHSGLYTAPRMESGPFVVSVYVRGLRATAVVMVGSRPQPA